MPVLNFLSRASDAHSIFPAAKYFGQLRDWLENGADSLSQTVFADIGDFKSFIAIRLSKTPRDAKAYSAILSRGMDCQDIPFEVVGMAREILDIGRRVSAISMPNKKIGESFLANLARMKNCGLEGDARQEFVAKSNEMYYAERREEVKRLFEFYDSRVKFISSEAALECLGREPFAYYLLDQAVSNSFKATFGASEKQKIVGNGQFIYDDYLNLPQIEPSITIKVEKTAMHAVVTVSDTGMGMSKEMVTRLFAENGHVCGFANIKDGNHASLNTFPYIADLSGIEIHVDSAIGKGTTFVFYIPLDASRISIAA